MTNNLIFLLVAIYHRFWAQLKIYHLLNESPDFQANYLKLVKHFVPLFQFHRELIHALQLQH